MPDASSMPHEDDGGNTNNKPGSGDNSTQHNESAGQKRGLEATTRSSGQDEDENEDEDRDTKRQKVDDGDGGDAEDYAMNDNNDELDDQMLQDELQFLAGQLEGLVDDDDEQGQVEQPTESGKHTAKEDTAQEARSEVITPTTAPEPEKEAEKPASSQSKKGVASEPEKPAAGSGPKSQSETESRQSNASRGKGKQKVTDKADDKDEQVEVQSTKTQTETTKSHQKGKAKEKAKPAAEQPREKTPVSGPAPPKLKLAIPPNRALMLLQSLPLLDNLSTQLLNLISRATFDELITMLTEPETENGQILEKLVKLFDNTKNLYTSEPFLPLASLYEVCRSEAQRQVLQRTNLCTFVCAILGSIPVGFFDLNENFLNSFVPPNGKINKTLGSLFLDLKTQAYISSLRQKDDLDRSLDEILTDLFPEDMDKQLVQRRGSATRARNNVMGPHETKFIETLRNRHDFLKNKTNADELADEYSWMGFLKNLYDFVSKNVESLVSTASLLVSEPQKVEAPKVPASVPPLKQPQPPDSKKKNTGSYLVWNVYGKGGRKQLKPNTATTPATPQVAAQPASSTPAQKNTEAALSGTTQSQSQPESKKTARPVSKATTATSPSTSTVQRSAPAAEPTATEASTSSGLPAASLAVEKTMAALPSHNGKKVKYFDRRTWSQEEEQALMDGLDRVKGPHWSHILDLHGPGGSLSEALKNRSQVQLKDKARNLKLFFVKHGMEIPPILQYVTGDANKRGHVERTNAKSKAKVMNNLQSTAAFERSNVDKSTNDNSPTPSFIDPAISTGDTTAAATDDNTERGQYGNGGDDDEEEEEEEEEDLERLMQDITGLIQTGDEGGTAMADFNVEGGGETTNDSQTAAS